MQHFDEYTLELFVLGAERVASQREQIQAHLRECRGCASVVEHLRAFHADLANELDSPEAPTLPGRALSRRRQSMTKPFGPDQTPLRYAPRTPMQKVRYLVIRHPVAAAAAGISLAIIFVALGMLISIPMKDSKAQSAAEIKDWNPVTTGYDDEIGAVDIYNRESQLLWKGRFEEGKSRIVSERTAGVRSTIIVDLDGDGTNEVLSTAVFVGDTIRETRHLRVFDGRRRVLRDTVFKENVPYPGRTDYSPYFDTDMALIRDAREPGKKEVLVMGNSLGRSPTVIFRLNSKLEILGEYWHFGDLAGLYLRDLNGDGVGELIALGQNDVEDNTRGQFPVMIVLNPDSIVGRRRSSACPVYALGVSGAEVNYIRFPLTSMDNAVNSNGMASALHDQDSAALSVTVTTDAHDGNKYNFSYLLSFDSSPISAKSNDVTDRMYDILVKKGLLKGSIDRAYLDELKSRIQYWDGQHWRKEVASVRSAPRVP